MAPEEEALLLLAAERTTSGSDANPITDVGMITWNERIDSMTNPTKEGISHITGGKGSAVVWGMAVDGDGDVIGYR